MLPRCPALLLVALLTLAPVPLSAQTKTDTNPDTRLVEDYEKSLVAVMEKVEPAFVFIGGGSGVIISPDGLMLTNHHVAERRPRWEIFLPGGKRYEAILLGSDPRGDLTLLRVESKDPLPYVALGNSDQLRPGDPVFAVGNPIGIGYDDFSPTFTLGIVSAVNRCHANYTDAVQTDAPINPGNSGGPLFNAKGELVGINGQIQTRFQGRVNSGVGYAISVEQVKLWLDRLKAADGGIVSHATLSGLVVARRFEERGALIERSGGAAEAAGLRVGDRIIAADGRAIWNFARFQGIIGMMPGGAKVRLDIERGTAKVAIELTLDSREEPAAPARPTPTPRAGVAFIGASLADAREGGVLVTELVPGGPSARAGLREDDRILAWNGTALKNTQALVVKLDAAKPNEKISLKIVRGGKELEIAVTLGQRPGAPR